LRPDPDLYIAEDMALDLDQYKDMYRPTTLFLNSKSQTFPYFHFYKISFRFHKFSFHLQFWFNTVLIFFHILSSVGEGAGLLLLQGHRKPGGADGLPRGLRRGEGGLWADAPLRQRGEGGDPAQDAGGGRQSYRSHPASQTGL